MTSSDDRTHTTEDRLSVPPTMPTPSPEVVTVPTPDSAFGAHREESAAQVSDDSLVHAHLGNYQVVSLLGKGGFGRVYKATDTRLGRTAAIKLLLDPLDSNRRSLFVREAKVLAALSKHPNIVEIYEWNEYQSQLYFVLEYVEGNASQLLEEYPEGLPLPLALRIIAECAEALHHAHKAGVLHRDIKPANILIESESRLAKLTDFGLARFRESGEFTIAGMISGSPPYMSPEQASGGDLDERSDVFSLGVTLYELLSGKRPFEGVSSQQIMERIRTNVRVPLQDRRADLPPAIYRIVDAATAHEPGNRFQNAAEFARKLRIALDRIERTGQVPDAILPAPTKRMERRMPRWIAVLPLVLIALVAPLFLRGGGAPSSAPSGAGEREASPHTVFAEAEDLMNKGRFPEAEGAYAAALEQAPGGAEAQFALGLARLKQGKTAEAEAAFNDCTDPALRAAGLAAAAYEKEGAAARPALEAAPATNRPGDLALPRARVDALEEKYGEVVATLSPLDAAAFRYAWQFNDARRLLGQAHYHLNEFAQAKSIFEQSGAENDAVAAAYLKLIAGKLDEARRQSVRDAAQRLRALMDGGSAADAAADPWTSRPLSFFVLPVNAGKSRFAAESGLADVLPVLLGDRMEESTPMRVVDRELIQDILQEQELSAQVSTRSGALALGQVLGARLILQCSFDELGRKQFLTIKASDVETTKLNSVQVEITPDTDERALIDLAAGALWERLHPKYPLQARLHADGGAPVVNIGANVGLEPGATFQIMKSPGEPPIEGALVRVDGGVGDASARAQIEGLPPADLPENPAAAWYVREVTNPT